MCFYFSGRFVRGVCHWLLSLFRCLNKRIHAEPREQTEEKLLLDERKSNAERDAALYNYYVLRKEVPAGTSYLKLCKYLQLFSFFFLFWSHLRLRWFCLPFIKMRGVVYGRYCSTKLWRYFLPRHNSGNPSSEDVFIQGICDCSEFQNGIL